MGSIHPSRHRRWMLAWACGLAAVFLCLGGWLARLQVEARRLERAEWAALLDPVAADPGLTVPSRAADADAAQVSVGIYLERIEEVSLHDSRWTASFDLWFSWRGDADLAPAERLVFVDGTIVQRQKLVDDHEGGNHYERHAVTVEFTRSFRIAHFPLDDHLLLLAFENGAAERSRLVFVLDTRDSEVSSRVAVPGYVVTGLVAIEKPHSYKTTRGQPGLTPGTKTTFSQARFGLFLERDGFGLFLKMFQALFVAVAIALLPCFIRPTDVDPRFGLGVGALFAAVANAYLTGSYVPETSVFTLADIMNLLGIVTILVTLVQSTVSLHFFQERDDPGLSRRFDRISFIVVLAGFVAATVLVLRSAVA